MTCLFDAHVQVPDLKGLDCNEDVDLKNKTTCFLDLCLLHVHYSDGK